MALIPLDWEHLGHVLVIPQSAVRNFGGLNDRDAMAILHMVKRIATAQQRIGQHRLLLAAE